MSFKAAMRKASRTQLSHDTTLEYVIELGAMAGGSTMTSSNSKVILSREVHLYVKHNVTSDFLETNQASQVCCLLVPSRACVALSDRESSMQF
jgi:hypothetical protein